MVRWRKPGRMSSCRSPRWGAVKIRSAAARISNTLAAIERALQPLAEAEVAAQEMIEYQPEVVFGLG